MTHYDFYYSNEQALRTGRCHKVQGIDFTEMVPTGTPPFGNFDDCELVASNLPEEGNVEYIATSVSREGAKPSVFGNQLPFMSYGSQETPMQKANRWYQENLNKEKNSNG